jgi:formylglycine-generating enzyme required for sulfatase activity
MIRTLAALTILSAATASVCLADEPLAKKEIPGATAAEFKPYVEAMPKYFVKIEMVPVKGGKTIVTLPAGPRTEEIKDLWVAKCEIRWDDYDVFRRSEDQTQAQRDADDKFGKNEGHLRTRPSKPNDNPDRGYGHAGFAVNSVAFRGAKDYCKWLSDQTGRTYRLPTEAEFEYLLRAGKADNPTPDELLGQARIKENSDNGNGEVPQPVGQFPANPLGLHDLYGNLAEWCTPLEGDLPVVRGGSFKTAVKILNPGYRQPHNVKKWQDRDSQDPKSVWWLSDGDFIGFRVVRDREEKK